MKTRLQALAADYSRRFEKRTRENGAEFQCITDGEETPELEQLIRDAHGEMFPDDWRYAFIVDALDALEECSDPDGGDAAEYLPEYVYTHEQLNWLASHSDRLSDANEYASEYGFSEKDGILGLVAGAMRREQETVLDDVRGSLYGIIQGVGLNPEDELPEGAESWDELLEDDLPGDDEEEAA